ncbi:AraC family transcriptional regulator [Sphingobacterium nematocida]|uniref:AraC family transcriptional regulator n=1 Tax=Sphingobacterium nematocida TaxID=1513896 RepID=UPI00373FD53C
MYTVYPKRIHNIFKYVAESFAEQIALKDVADQACLSPKAFCRYFKKHTGQILFFT